MRASLNTRLGGTWGFLALSAGQFVSTVGSALTGFSLAVWAYQQTGAVTRMSLIAMAASVPGMLLLPVAGALVDRHSRKAIMLLSDSASALATLVIALLLLAGSLEYWHIVFLVAVQSAAGAFQGPAYLATVPLLVPEDLLARASGLTQLRRSLSVALAPVLAGSLLLAIGIGGILLVDLATFLVALATLSWVHIPRPPAGRVHREGGKRLWGEIHAGWRYIQERKGLRGLLVVYTVGALLGAFGSVLYMPLILSFTSSAALGIAVSVATMGMVLGSLLVAARGLPRDKLATLVGSLFIGGLLVSATGIWPSATIITALSFAAMVLRPFGGGADQVIWQTRVAPELQGRVFALRLALVQTVTPVAYILAGPLADVVFEPLLAKGGPLAGSVGRVIGTGPGRGIGLMFILLGLSASLLAVAAGCHPRIRGVESETESFRADGLEAPGGLSVSTVDAPGRG